MPLLPLKRVQSLKTALLNDTKEVIWEAQPRRGLLKRQLNKDVRLTIII